ncbi:LuxR C-terminal-related transcriptional regulator [Nocardia gipuzkoensis]|uniref:LuxR C-terminal-related transcriptional regulator n=1 Tax=Nocardia gipuzkoensis TaxID=2749991 RepID=UPI003EE248F5
MDDSALYREGLAAIMAEEWGAAAVRTAADLTSMRTAITRDLPDIILLNLASDDSRALLVAARTASPASRVVVLGVREQDRDGIIDCAELGVAGYHLRSEPLDQLLKLIVAVAAGETLCSPRVTAVLLARLSSAAERGATARVLGLSPREAQILRLVDLGLSNREIADRLCIEVHTVKNHIHNLLAKLGVRRRADAAAVLHGFDQPAGQRGLTPTRTQSRVVPGSLR